MKVIELAGKHYQMGLQHAQQIRNLRPEIVKAMRQRLRVLEPYKADLQSDVKDLASVWEEVARTTLEMLRGIAKGLELEWEPFFFYTVASYLQDLLGNRAGHEGCTVWAATMSVAQQSAPILVKNRDYRPDHQLLQCLAYARPDRGYRYLYVTSAGSPAVFSSGMNEVGLAVADTHVSSLDIGPGMARYSVMMDLLEHHNNVVSALDYLRSVAHLGDGTLVVVDAVGDMVVFEAGHSALGIVWPEAGRVVSTNHFVTDSLRELWADRNLPELRGNSQNRYAKVDEMLEAARGRVNPGWAQRAMASHGGPRHAICRHAEVDPHSKTISTALYLPRGDTLFLANGQPCQDAFQVWHLIGGRRPQRERPEFDTVETPAPASVPMVRGLNPASE